MKRLLPVLALLSVNPAHADPAAAEHQIRAALTQWVEAANRGDWKSTLSVWAPDLIGWAPDGSDDTYAREKKGAEAPPSGPPKTTYALHIDEVIVDGSLAVVRDTWTQTTHADAGDKVASFRSFEVWRQQPDGRWKISRWIDGPMTPK